MKKWILTAAVLIAAGAAICFAAAAAMHFDYKELDSSKYETNSYPVTESFHSIFIDVSTEKITFRLSEGGDCRVVCLEEADRKHAVSVNDDVLTISENRRSQLSDTVGIHTVDQEITVYLPEREYAGLHIETDTGDIAIPADFTFGSIRIEGDTADVSCQASAEGELAISLTTGDISIASIKAGSIDLKVTTGAVTAESVECKGDVQIRVDTGRVKLHGMTCTNLISEGDTGDITLDSVIAADQFSISRTTGDVKFISSDADSIMVKTDTGDVTGSLLSDKVFVTETDTGKVTVPSSTSGGRCEISTDTGSIKIEIR